MKRFIFVLFLCISFVAAAAEEEADPKDDKLAQWRGAVQQLVLGLSRSSLEESFTPENLSQRNITIALNQQAGRFRAQVARAIQQAVGTTVSVCPPVDISDQAILSVRKELQDLGWTVEWKTLAEHYSSADPINMELLWPHHMRNPCDGNRRAFRVEVPIKQSSEEKEEQDK